MGSHPSWRRRLALLPVLLPILARRGACIFTGSAKGCMEAAFLTPDYTKVYSLDSTLPQGCSCRASDVALKECTIFDCTCVCDLTAGQCDYGCCCDSECTEDEVLRFKNADACLPEGPGSESYTKCFDASSLSEVNPSFPMTIGSSSQRALGNLLCVVADNSESKGRFLDDPGFPGSSVFQQSWGQKDYSYVTAASESNSGTSTQYGIGDPIPAAFGNGGYNARAAYGGYMPLPAADADGRCNEHNFVGFAETTYRSSCLRVVDPSDIATTCTTRFGAARFTENLEIAYAPGSSPSTTSSSAYFNVTVATVRYRNPFTLVESNFTRYDCNAYYTTHSTAVSGCSVAKSMTSHYASGYCRNAVVSICYDITRDDSGKIVSATADMVVTDLLINSTDAVSAVEQSFSVSFISSSSSSITRTSAAGNLVDRARSGNPGYLFGHPVLAGFTSTSGSSSAITTQYPGMGLSAVTVSGLCTDTMSDVVVQFGVDVRAGCSLELTRSQLETMCGGGGSYMSGGIPSFFNVTTTHVGIFGNADPLDVSQWLALDTSLTSATYLWDDTVGICYNLITSINYRFLTADVGKSNNPQKKIIAAQVEYGKEDLRFRVEDASTQSFVFSTTVTFIDYSASQASAVYTPPPPPVVFSVPYDVFYPFAIYSAASRTASTPSSSSSWALLVVLPVLTALLLVYDRDALSSLSSS